jgi:glycosyltransferase involved in cell wall biosynthesis
MSQSSAMVDKRIVVVIPAYKAAATLPLVLARIPPHVYKAIYRIVVVEDSDSQTPRSATPDLQIQHPKMEVIIRDYPGYGAAQKKGFRRALELEADIAVLLHADGQYAPEIMEELYRPLLETIPFEKLSNAFHYDGEMLLVGGRKKLRIADLPIPTHYGKETSYATPIPYGFEVLGVILKYFRGKYDYKNGHDPR